MITKKQLPLLVLGDIHNRWSVAEKILQALRGRYRQAILLGDYFDDRGDSPEDAASTARWLAQSVTKTDRVHLLGNHDLPYFYPTNPTLLCPSFSWPKQDAIAKEWGNRPRNCFKLAHYEDGWLLSHAGFAKEHAEGETAESLTHRANALLPRLHKDRQEPLLACGAGRGGTSFIGGITWLDWWCEFDPTPGLNQIVGHTSGVMAKAQLLRHGDNHASFINATASKTHRYQVRGKISHASVNWCFDNYLTQVGLLSPQRIDIVDTKQLLMKRHRIF
jgi:hypothetical protein